jgi:membrane protein implicated in regulation of membrane protease activity
LARWQIVLAASALVLGIGLLLIYLPVLRGAGTLFGLAVASLAVAMWLPDAAVLFSQAAVLGIVLALISGFLHRAISRRRSRGIVVTSKPSSVIERTASPSKSRAPELVGAASTLSAPGATDVPAADQNDE